jgi:hypothetical protein
MAVRTRRSNGYGCQPLEPAKAEISVDAESPGAGGSDVYRADPAWCRIRIGLEKSAATRLAVVPGVFPPRGGDGKEPPSAALIGH